METTQMNSTVGIVTLVNLIDPNFIGSLGQEFAKGSLVQNGDEVFLRASRSVGVPARVACQKLDGEVRFIVGHTIAEIGRAWNRGLATDARVKPFHPGYTEMWPAWHEITIPSHDMRDRTYKWLLPGPAYARYQESDQLPAEAKIVGENYIKAVAEACRSHLGSISGGGPIAVSLSGGMDSSGVLAVLLQILEEDARSNPVHTFTLAIDGGGGDLAQARQVISLLQPRFGRRLAHHEIVVNSNEVDHAELVRRTGLMIEDYRVLDFGAAMAGVVLNDAIGRMYTRGELPTIHHAFDGDGGNEVFLDYPLDHWSHRAIALHDIYQNPYLFLLGDDRKKLAFNPIHSAGMSRGYVRSFAVARHYGVVPHSPLIDPRVIDVGARMPMRELAPTEAKLHDLRGIAVQAGVEAMVGVRLPIFPKAYFQEGCSENRGLLSINAEESRELKRLILG